MYNNFWIFGKDRQNMTYTAAIGFFLPICDVTVMHRERLLFSPAKLGMAASLFVEFVFRVKGIAFYGSAASFKQHLCAIWIRTLGFFELLSLDVAVRAVLEAWTQQSSFWPLFSGQNYNRTMTGKPMPLVSFTSEQLSIQNCPRLLKLLISCFVCRRGTYVTI